MLDKIVDTTKAAIEISAQLKNIDLKSQIVCLQQEILNLKTENISLKKALDIKQNFNMQFENNVYFNVKSDGRKEGPYCSNCWDSEGKAIHMFDDTYIYMPVQNAKLVLGIEKILFLISRIIRLIQKLDIRLCNN